MMESCSPLLANLKHGSVNIADSNVGFKSFWLCFSSWEFVLHMVEKPESYVSCVKQIQETECLY